jgi:hypothetical protein
MGHVMAICLFLAFSVAPGYSAEEPLAGFSPAASGWTIAFERGRPELPDAPGASATVQGSAWVVQLPAEARAAVGLSSAPLPAADLSVLQEIRFWVRSDAVVVVQPYSQSSGWIFRNGGHEDVRLRPGEVAALRLQRNSMADPSMVQAIGIQVRPRSSRSPARLELLAVTAVRRPPEAPVDLAITSVDAPGEASRYRIHSTDFQLSRTYENPYDPAEIDVQAEVDLPSGRTQLVTGFWFQDYTVAPGTEDYEQYVPAGSPCWRVRFLPSETGTHRMILRARDRGGSVAQAGPVAFEVRSAPLARGPVRRHAVNPLALAFVNGAPYHPRGHNVAFEDGNPDLNGISYYGTLLSSLATAGENWTRFWMTDFARTALEWGRNHFSGFYSGAGIYSQRAAWRVDSFFDIAMARDIQVQLVLNDHGQFSSYVNARWDEGNPYGSAEGGPVPQSGPELFFSDPAARELFRRRLRYTVARWGAYPNLLCWQLWNEVQFAGSRSRNFQNDEATRAAIADWHSEMSGFLKAQDPFGHMVTTSSDDPGSSGWSPIWNLAAIDLVQSHHYGQPPATRDTRIAQYLEAAQQEYRKPVLVAEMGVKASAEPECNFDPISFLADPSIPEQERTSANRDHMTAGTTLRNAIWAASMRGGGAMNWWWGCYLCGDPRRNRVAPDFPLNERLFPQLTEFWGGEDVTATMRPASLAVRGDITGYGIQGARGAYVWLRDAREAYGSGYGPASTEGRAVQRAALMLSGMNPGSYVVSPFATTAGGQAAPEFAASSGPSGQLEVALPAVVGDIALKIGDGTERAWGIAPRCARVWVTADRDGALQTGHARLQPAPGFPAPAAGAVLTFFQGGNPTSDLMVAAAGASKEFWSVAEIGAPSDTGWAVVNPGSRAALAQLQLFDAGGTAFRTHRLELAPGGHAARFLHEEFPDVAGPFRGTLMLTSNEAVAALTLRGTQNERGEFVLTTLPMHRDTDSEVRGRVVLPQVADGGGYQTELLLVNPFDVRLEGRLHFHRPDGRPWSIELDGSSEPEREYSLAPHGSIRAVTSGAGAPVSSGYCTLDAGDARVPAATAVIRYLRPGLQSETGVPFVVPSTSASAFWESGSDAFTGVAFANSSDTTRRVRLELFARGGIEKKLQAEIELPPGRHFARLLAELYPDLPAGYGLLRYFSDGPVAFMALRMRNTPRGDHLMSSLQMGPAGASGEVIFPQMVAGGGYEMRFVLLNAGDTTTEGRLVFYDSSGSRARMLFR